MVDDVVYPLPMPNTGIASVEQFELIHADAVNVLRGGLSFGTQIGPPHWAVSMTTSNLKADTERRRLWRRFITALRGSKKLALLYDPDQPYPQAYGSATTSLLRVGGGAFDGTADVRTRIDQRTFDFEGFPANFELLATDYVSFMKNGRYYLTSVVNDVTGLADGRVMGVSVEPEVPELFDAFATIMVVKAYGEFILEPGSIRAPKGLEGGTISFTAKSRAM